MKLGLFENAGVRFAGCMLLAVLAWHWVGEARRSRIQEPRAPLEAQANEERHQAPPAGKAESARKETVQRSPTARLDARPAVPAQEDALKEGESLIGRILESDTPPAQKAEQMLSLMPRLSHSRQAEAAPHLVNLLNDERFLAAGHYLTNSEVAEAVQSVFMAELLNRPEQIKLPLCLAIASTAGHRHAQEAKDLLGLHVTEDYGTNWPAWEQAIHSVLAQNR